jgi:hypothetical protein
MSIVDLPEFPAAAAKSPTAWRPVGYYRAYVELLRYLENRGIVPSSITLLEQLGLSYTFRITVESESINVGVSCSTGQWFVHVFNYC